MAKLGLIFPLIKLFLTNRKDLFKNLFHFVHDTNSKNAVIHEHKMGKGLPVVSILDLFPNFNETIDNYSYLDGTSRAIDICILKLLAKRNPNTNYIEFGTWRGESLVNLSSVSKHSTSISFDEDEMKRNNFNDSSIKASRFFVKNLNNLTEIKGNTLTYDFTPLEKKFDLIFVDADHTYAAVKKDTENAFKLLKDENSVIIWHDYGKSYESINWQVFRGIIEGSPVSERNKIYHISNSLCAIYTNQKIKTGYPEVSVPNKKFTVSIKGETV